jgi:hypothetical protein
MQQLLGWVNEALLKKEDMLRCFSNLGVQVEGWLKAEILFQLERKMQEGLIDKFDREVRVGRTRRKLDLLVSVQGIVYVLELKHWLIGQQRGQQWNSRQHFNAAAKQLERQASDLSRFRGEGYFLILTTRNPGESDWSRGLQYIQERLRRRHISLQSITEPQQFPEHYFLGLLKVNRKP